MNKTNAIFCGIFVLLAVFRFPSTDMRISYQVLAEAGAMLALCLLVGRINPWIGLFGVMVLISTHFPVYTRATFYANFAVTVGLLWFYAATKLATPDGLMDAMLVIALCNVGFQVLQYLHVDPIFVQIRGGATSAVGLMCNRNETAALMAFCLPAALRKKRWLFAVPIIAGLVMARSTGGVVAAGVAVVVFAMLTMEKADVFWVMLFALGGMLAFLLIDTPSLDPRLELWGNGKKLWADHFWMGLGIGHWKAYYPETFQTNAMTAHNDVFQAVVEMGVPVAVVVAGFAVSVGRRIKRNPVASVGVIAVAVNSLVHFPFHVATTAIIAVSWLAIFEMQEAQGGS